MTTVDFPDWNVNANSVGSAWGQLFGTIGVNPSSQVNTGFFYVGNFDTVILQTHQNVAQSAQWIVNWVTSQSYLEIPDWEDTFQKNTTCRTNVAMAVKAPYVYFTVINNGASFMNIDGLVQGVRGGAAPGDAIPPQVTSDGMAISVPASGTTFVIPTVSMVGPASLWGLSANGGVIRLHRWNGSAWDLLNGMSFTGSLDLEIPVIVPMDDIRVALVNTTAAAINFWYALTHGG